MKKMIAVNECGYRIGEDHHNAKLTNHEIDLLLELREDGWSYRRLADKFEIGKSTVRDICKGICRSQTLAEVRVKSL